MDKLSILAHAMNPIQAQLLDEERLEHYSYILKKKPKTPYGFAQEVFDKLESEFIRDYFKGDQDSFNEWVKNNSQYLKGGE